MSQTVARTKRQARQARGPYGRVSQALDELDDRLGIAKGGRIFLDKIFPDHWSFMLGEIALYSFVVLVATGVFLTLYYVPSTNMVLYHGPYAPLNGRMVSAAYASTVNISLSVRAGLLMRQMHHWSADIFLGAIVIHMARIFFTGAFRKPRELNWFIGITLLMLSLANGFIGYSLPDDLISGTGVRILYSIILSIPFVGSYLAFWIFGGNFPGNSLIPRLFIVHVLILPVIIAGLIGAHLALLVRQKHTQFAGKGRTEDNVVGSPMYPTFMAKTTGYLFMITAVTAILGGIAQINPIWQFGQYVPDKISYAVQPDWYMGWLDGALRIMPSWEATFLGHTIPFVVLLPSVVFPGIIFTLCYVWPVIERRFTGDNEIHHLLDRPRDRPKRTAAGAAMLAFMFTLLGASATDVIANFFQVSLNQTLWAFRILIFVIPIVVGFFAWRIALEMQHGGLSIGKRKRTVLMTRSATGEYHTTDTDAQPDDERMELPPIPVPVYIEEPKGNGEASPGYRTVSR
ncbi:MAG: cytochrome bc1 complex cytochrome b subunit [Acidimicrobiales bacterium]